MMTLLKHIKEKKCPICGAFALIKTRSEYTGCEYATYEEIIYFNCGCEIRRDDERQITSIQCPNHPDLIAIEEKRKKTGEEIVDFVKNLDVDSEYKKWIIDDITDHRAKPPEVKIH